MDDLDLSALLNNTELESLIIGAVAVVLVWGISKLPGVWKNRVSKVIDKTDEKLDE